MKFQISLFWKRSTLITNWHARNALEENGVDQKSNIQRKDLHEERQKIRPCQRIGSFMNPPIPPTAGNT